MGTSFFTIIAILLAASVAEPPALYRARFYQQQQQQAEQAPYEPAGAPSGPLLLVPGEYVVQVNAPYQQQYPDAIVTAPIQEYGTPFTSGQYQLQPGVVQQTYNQKQSRGNVKFTAGNQEEQGQYRKEEQQQQQAPNGRYQQEQAQQTVKGRYQQEASSGKYQQAPRGRYQQEQDQQAPSGQYQQGQYRKEERDQQIPRGKYQEQGQYQQPADSRSNSPKQQVEYYTEDRKEFKSEQTQNVDQDDDDEADNEEDEVVEKEPVEQGRFQQPQFGKYTQRRQEQRFGRLQQSKGAPEVQDQYSKVDKYTPPRKLYSKPTTEQSGDEVNTTEVAQMEEVDKSQQKGQYNNQDTESVDGRDEANKETQGFYYLLLPDGKLQKVVYMTEEDLKKMAFVARLQYQNVEPIQGPVYSYNPANSPFVQVF